jgi:hypothetical protein
MGNANMIRTLFKQMLCCAVFMMVSGSYAWAQNCDYVYEVISTLRKPVIGSYNLWDTVYGDENVREDIKAVVNVADSDNVVIAVESAQHLKKVPELVLAEIDRRGRPVWEKRHNIDGLDHVVGMIRDQERFIVYGNKATDEKGRLSVWIGVFDKSGEKLEDLSFGEKNNSISVTKLIPAYEKDVFLLAAVKDAGEGAAQSSVLKWIDLKSKKVVRQVNFSIGADNEILDIIPQANNQYLAAGGIREPDGRWSGWLANLNKDGGFIWQRNLARGNGGRFNVIKSLNDQYVIVAGEAMPSGEATKKAAWVVAVNAVSSDIAWQRYYRDGYNLNAVGLETYPDGQISVLINSNGSETAEEFDYARLLTLNPRGAVLASDGYYNGVGANATGLFSGKNKERIIYGSTDIAYKVERVDPKTKEKTEETLKNHQGWIVAGSAAEKYQDPCRPVVNYLE